MEYKKMNDENDGQYIYRICSIKEKNGWTWQEVADILNGNLGNEFTESAYRKKFQMFNQMLKDNEKQVFTDDEYLKQIQEKTLEMKKERQKLNTANVEMQRMIRQEARFEMFYENIKNAIETLPMPEIVRECTPFGDEKAYLLAIADIHAGAKFDLPTNSYSMEECKRRFGVLLDQVSNYVKENGINYLYVASLSDDIQGILRISDLQLNETSVVEATVFIARMLASFLNELSAYCYVDYYHVGQSNHSQTRPLGTKASEMASEDVEYVIANYVKDMLQFNNRVSVNSNFGCDYIYIPIFDYNIIAMHGHTIRSLDTALRDLSSLHNKLIDYIVCGHLHTGKTVQGNERESYDTEVLICPSFQGTDPYAYNKLGKSSKAACKMFIFDEKYGCTGTEKFILN